MRPRGRRKGNIKVDVTDTGCENVDCIQNYNTVNTRIKLRVMYKAGHLTCYYNKEGICSMELILGK